MQVCLQFHMESRKKMHLPDMKLFVFTFLLFCSCYFSHGQRLINDCDCTSISYTQYTYFADSTIKTQMSYNKKNELIIFYSYFSDNAIKSYWNANTMVLVSYYRNGKIRSQERYTPITINPTNRSRLLSGNL